MVHHRCGDGVCGNHDEVSVSTGRQSADAVVGDRSPRPGRRADNGSPRRDATSTQTSTRLSWRNPLRNASCHDRSNMSPFIRRPVVPNAVLAQADADASLAECQQRQWFSVAWCDRRHGDVGFGEQLDQRCLAGRVHGAEGEGVTDRDKALHAQRRRPGVRRSVQT